MPGTVLSALHALSSGICTATLQQRNRSSCITGEKTEVREARLPAMVTGLSSGRDRTGFWTRSLSTHRGRSLEEGRNVDKWGNQQSEQVRSQAQCLEERELYLCQPSYKEREEVEGGSSIR